MASYDKPAFTWPSPGPSKEMDAPGIGLELDFPSPQQSVWPNRVNAFGQNFGGGVTPDEWGMPIVG